MKISDLIIPAAVVGVIVYAISKFKNPFGDWGSWNNPFGGGSSGLDLLTDEELGAVEGSGGTVTETQGAPIYFDFTPFGSMFDYFMKNDEVIYKGTSPPMLDKSKGLPGAIASFTPTKTYTRTDIALKDKPKSNVRVAADAWAAMNPALFPGYKIGTTVLDKVTGADKKMKVTTTRQYTKSGGSKGQQQLFKMMQRDLRRFSK